MPRKKTAKKKTPKIGRPRVVFTDVDWASLGTACKLTDKLRRIALVMGHDEKTINRIVKEKHGTTFSVFADKVFQSGNMTLLAKQFDQAIAGNTTMLIWLGKNRLGQADKPEVADEDRQPSSSYFIELKVAE